MITNDADVSVVAWATYYYLKDSHTNELWSRNRWGTTTSIPDLYASMNAADRQRCSGKASMTVKDGRNPIVCSCILGYESTTVNLKP